MGFRAPIAVTFALLGIGYLGYVDIPESDTKTTYYGAGAIWTPTDFSVISWR
jgi:hypothetical protein